MKKVLFLILSLFLWLNSIAQKDYSYARAGFKVQGVYVFIACEPIYDYEYIATVKAKITWTGLSQEAFEKVIKKAKKKYPYFNGLIFHNSDLNKADLIEFRELATTRGGFKVGDKVSFILLGKQYVGEVIELQSTKKKASVKYIDDNGEEHIKRIGYTELTRVK